jgi:hypothetical protein
MAHYDPHLLDEPEWQEALLAAQSPEPRRERTRRISPSARTGASDQSTHSFYLTGGLSDDELNTSDIQIISSPIHLAPSASVVARPSYTGPDQTSARTNPSTRTLPRSRPIPTHTPSNPSAPFLPQSNAATVPDSDDEILILDDGELHSSSSSAMEAQSSSMDLDHQLALQLQRQFDGNVGEVELEILEDDISTRSHARPPRVDQSHTRNNVPRAAAPKGPQRGSDGLRERRQGEPRSLGTLPPVSRTRSSPIPPAHTPHPRSTAKRTVSAMPRTHEVHVSTTNVNNEVSPFAAERVAEREALFERVHWIDEDDEDEARLRSGVSTRRRNPLQQPTRSTSSSLSDLGIDVFSLVNRRPYEGPGSRQQMLAQDEDYAMMLQTEEFGLPRHRHPHRGGRGGRGVRRGDGFEVDTNDYEAMLRLSERAPPIKRGASSAIIKALPITKASNDDCTICQGTAETAMVALPCLHNFHKECILPHLKTSRNCPNCRHELE